MLLGERVLVVSCELVMPRAIIDGRLQGAKIGVPSLKGRPARCRTCSEWLPRSGGRTAPIAEERGRRYAVLWRPLF
jgi:hypothetical protein